jgi:hypothetical protein
MYANKIVTNDIKYEIISLKKLFTDMGLLNLLGMKPPQKLNLCRAQAVISTQTSKRFPASNKADLLVFWWGGVLINDACSS